MSVRVSDLEEVSCLLVEYVDAPEVWGETIRRFEQALGITTAQMRLKHQQP